MQILRSQEFAAWLAKLRDRQAVARIADRLDRLQRDGNFGTTRSLGNKLFEMKLDYGPGYRLYYSQRGTQVVLFLLGGDKQTQQKDIQRAKQLLLEWKWEE